MNDESDGQPDDIDLALPWYATGRLSEAERAHIEAALDRDEELRRRLAMVHEEAAETIALNERLPAAPAAALDRLMARIELHEAQHPRRHLFDRLLGWIAARLEPLSPRALAWSAVAAAIVICVQAGLLGGMLVGGHEGATYKTASYGSNVEEHGTYALVAFVGTASLMEVTDFLRNQHAVLSGGPKPGDFYRIKISDQKLSGAALKARLASLRAQTHVVSFIVPETAKP